MKKRSKLDSRERQRLFHERRLVRMIVSDNFLQIPSVFFSLMTKEEAIFLADLISQRHKFTTADDGSFILHHDVMSMWTENEQGKFVRKLSKRGFISEELDNDAGCVWTKIEFLNLARAIQLLDLEEEGL